MPIFQTARFRNTSIQSIEKTTNFIIVHLSLCKVRKNVGKEPHFPKKKCKLTGITQEEIYSLGIFNLDFEVQNNSYYHRFQLLTHDFQIDTDGIILVRRDFLERFFCSID